MLVPSQTAVKGGNGFEIAVRIDNLRGGDWCEMQNSAQCVWSKHSIALEIKLLLGCFYVFNIANTEIDTCKEYDTKEWGKSRWGFGVMNLYFGLFCSASVLFNSSELGFDSFASRNNAWQTNLNKRLLIPVLHMFVCLVSIHRKMWIQEQTSCLHQRLVSLAWFWCYGGSYFFQKYSSLHAQSLNNICTVATPGQILAR